MTIQKKCAHNVATQSYLTGTIMPLFSPSSCGPFALITLFKNRPVCAGKIRDESGCFHLVSRIARMQIASLHAVWEMNGGMGSGIRHFKAKTHDTWLKSSAKK